MTPTYYDVLRILPTASDRQVHAAYRALAAEVHPDVNRSADAAARFREIHEAFEVLGSPERRRSYDDQLRQGSQGRSYTASAHAAPTSGAVVRDISSRSRSRFKTPRSAGALALVLGLVALTSVGIAASRQPPSASSPTANPGSAARSASTGSLITATPTQTPSPQPTTAATTRPSRVIPVGEPLAITSALDGRPWDLSVTASRIRNENAEVDLRVVNRTGSTSQPGFLLDDVNTPCATDRGCLSVEDANGTRTRAYANSLSIYRVEVAPTGSYEFTVIARRSGPGSPVALIYGFCTQKGDPFAGSALQRPAVCTEDRLSLR
ncbi:MAG: hypothetical protein FJ034_01780 [Chloroflexi bacterium]|nr:hypothetical protein [Chloroflexota bacterium]